MTATVILIGFPKVTDQIPLNTMWKVIGKQPVGNRKGHIQVVLERC
jgi:hypothetical protein